ncbi:glycoside hydrolase family 13 protein [Roseburia sp. AM59-24XD]|jgi:alpha-glucosidase|uniref:glycoside hydrolase family 13 protein n=1 Tax=Roseburia sp. AM59-24XD TaxID=2293138 RepID=UPI001FA9F131|nr:glycoside hydrolase family 13 protein [Roseburia sp. AM59-24XD]
MDLNVQFYRMSKQMKTQLYLDNLTTIFNPQALFADGTEFYRCPAEPDPYDRVRLRLRCARENLDSVILVFNDERIEMEKLYNDRLFDYYETFVQLGTEQVFYYFEIHCGQMTCYYNNVGLCNSVEEYYNFTMTPGFHTPDWAKGAVFYQIYVDRFYNGDRSNDVEDDEYFYIGEGTSKVTDWNKYPAAMGVREFYGGDIAGVMQKLDYLQELGVEVLYLNPIFVSPSNHKYDIQDYDYVDPHFGRIVKDEGEVLQRDENGNLKADPTYPNKSASRYICRVTDKENLEASNQLFAEFVEEVHRRGMKVILDGVFNHCGSFNKWLDRECIYENAPGYEKGAYVAEDSPYNTFFKFRERQWPYNPHYDGWWGHDTLPKLNYEESPSLFDYIMHVGRKWVSPPYNVDGWRLDVAADLGQSGEYNHYFWKEFRRNVKEANPDALVLAEHYGDPTEWLKGDEWDTVMNYDAFMEPLTWFLTGVEKHSDEYRQDQLGNPDSFFGSMRHFMTRFHTQSLLVAMNELSNHDHSRFLTRTNRKVGRTAYLGPEAAGEGIDKSIMRLAVMIQMTWPGAPTIYYGDEAGLCGWTDPDNRRAYPWGSEDQELIDFHKEIIRIHKDYQALKTGSILFLHGQYSFISYGRFDEQDKFVIAINSGEQPVSIDLPVWRLGMTEGNRMARLINTSQDGFSLETAMYNIENGILHLNCPPKYGVVIKNLV